MVCLLFIQVLVDEYVFVGCVVNGVEWLDGLLVLLVDDDMQFQEVLIYLFCSLGVQVQIVFGVKEVLMCIGVGLFDIFVSDFVMLGMDGYVLL